MKILKRSIIGLFLAVLIFGLSGQSAEAADFEGVETYTLPAGETQDEDLFVSAQTITIDGDINGDLFVGGDTITINGDVDGNVFFGGGTINVNGAVSGDIIGGGQTFTLNGSADDVRVGGASITINGDVGDDFMAAAAIVTLNGKVGNDAYVGTDSLKFGESARISGKLSYTTPEPLSQADRVAASSEYFESSNSYTAPAPPSAFALLGSWIVRTIFAVIGYVVIAWLLLRFMPQLLTKPTGLIESDLGRTAGWGLVLTFVAPFVLFFVTIVIGIFFGFGAALALSFATFSMLALIWLLSPIIIGYWIGSKFTDGGQTGILGAVAAVAILITLPLVGGIFTFFSYIVALGSILLLVRNDDNIVEKSPSDINIQTA